MAPGHQLSRPQVRLITNQRGACQMKDRLYRSERVLKPQVYTEVRGEGYDDIPDNIKV